MHSLRKPMYPIPFVSMQYSTMIGALAPCSSNLGVSRKRSPEIQAVARYAPFAKMQKCAMNHIQFRRTTNAIASGISTPSIGPDHNVTSGFGSGLKLLYGRCHGRRSAFFNVPPQNRPTIMCPDSCVKVMTHQDTMRSSAKWATRLTTQFALQLGSIEWPNVQDHWVVSWLASKPPRLLQLHCIRWFVRLWDGFRTRTQHRGTRTRTRFRPLPRPDVVGSIESTSRRSVSNPLCFVDVQGNRLGRPKPLVTRRSIDSRQSFGDLVREGNLFDRQAIDIKSFVVESRLGNRSPFEYEYEYRCTEYEYDCPGERQGSVGREKTCKQTATAFTAQLHPFVRMPVLRGGFPFR